MFPFFHVRPVAFYEFPSLFRLIFSNLICSLPPPPNRTHCGPPPPPCSQPAIRHDFFFTCHAPPPQLTATWPHPVDSLFFFCFPIDIMFFFFFSGFWVAVCFVFFFFNCVDVSLDVFFHDVLLSPPRHSPLGTFGSCFRLRKSPYLAFLFFFFLPPKNQESPTPAKTGHKKSAIFHCLPSSPRYVHNQHAQLPPDPGGGWGACNVPWRL